MSLVKLALIFLAAHVAAAIYFLLNHAPGTAAALHGLPLDDAWIHMVYARSLAAWHGFAYNPGQLETGSTSPLWAICLVPATWLARVLGISVVIPAKCVGVLTGLAASLGAARALRSLGFTFAVQLAAGLAIALDPSLAFAQVSGMEVMLASALALWAVAELADEQWWPATLAAALVPLARPEMIVIALPVLAMVGWRMHRDRVGWGAYLKMIAPFLLTVGGWMLYCQLVSGYPLPSTFYAKFKSHPEIWSRNVAVIVGEVLPGWPWFTYGAGIVLWLLGSVLLWRRRMVGMLAALFPVAYLCAVACAQPLPQGRPFYWQRYLLPALPFALLAVTVGGAHVAAWAWRTRRATWAPARALVALVLIALSLAPLPLALRRGANLYAWNCQNIDELNVAMGLWLRDHVPANDTIAVTDAGAIRYFGEHPVLDIVGLNNHRLLHQLLHRPPAAPLDLANVNWVTSFPSLVPRLREGSGWQVAHQVATSNLTICDCPQSQLVTYRRILP